MFSGILWWIENSEEAYLFEMEIWNRNASLLNRIINFFQYLQKKRKPNCSLLNIILMFMAWHYAY